MDVVDYPLLNKSQASFYDFNTRVVWTPDEKNSIELSGYLSHDAFRLNSDTTYGYSNMIGSLKWSRTLTGKAHLSVSAANSNYKYNVSSLSAVEKAFDLNYRINYSSVRGELSLLAGRIHDLNGGIELGLYSVLPGDFQPASSTSLVKPETIERERAMENALYLEDRMKLSEQASLSIGLRYSWFEAFGPKTVLMYEPALPKSISTIIDTVSFPSGRPYQSYSGPEFRMSFNYMLTNSSSVKLNYNRTRQYLHLLTNTVSISPTDLWKISDYYIRPQVADQYSAGYYLTIP
ncbi:MAG: TonB-dependent receptor [Marinilabiliales bacterium]|nr:TonB-dependent receptor [Marinilabiliales bacterium]